MENIVISLGGSTIIPDDIDTVFLKRFKALISSYKNNFVIFCGGGSIARKYQESLKNIIGDDSEALDWMGISATHLNAFLMRCIFYDIAEPEIIKDPTKPIRFKKQLIIAAGWKPGWSTDYDAVLIAKNIGAKKVINITNTPYVYDKDPKKHKDAKPIKHISWKDFRKIVGNEWSPGLNMPFDPIAAKEAEKQGLEVIITDNDINNLKDILDGKEFEGSLIR